jgi:hypothetical protein
MSEIDAQGSRVRGVKDSRENMDTKTVNIYIANTVRAKGRLNEVCS